MNIAIVGTSHVNNETEEVDVIDAVNEILNDCSARDLIISGGAKGVDTIAIKVAKKRGFGTMVIYPESEYWNGINGKTGYMARNIKIVNESDKLFCISVPTLDKKSMCYHHDKPQNHRKTAGCWTMNKMIYVNREAKLVLTNSQQ